MLTQYQKWMSMQNHFKVSAQRNPKRDSVHLDVKNISSLMWLLQAETAEVTWMTDETYLPLKTLQLIGISSGFEQCGFLWMGAFLSFFLDDWAYIKTCSKKCSSNAMPKEKNKQKNESYISHSKGLNMLNVHNSTIRKRPNKYGFLKWLIRTKNWKGCIKTNNFFSTDSRDVWP